MEIGEPALPTPELITQAGLEYVSRGQVKYTPAAGLYELTDVTHPNDISIKIVGYENT
jgi:aspartate/methionine/tyrosine aminotransferase